MRCKNPVYASTSSLSSCAHSRLLNCRCRKHVVSDLTGGGRCERYQWSGEDTVTKIKRTEGGGSKGEHLAGGIVSGSRPDDVKFVGTIGDWMSSSWNMRLCGYAMLGVPAQMFAKPATVKRSCSAEVVETQRFAKRLQDFLTVAWHPHLGFAGRFEDQWGCDDAQRRSKTIPRHTYADMRSVLRKERCCCGRKRKCKCGCTSLIGRISSRG
jgi:hypothetical protein